MSGLSPQSAKKAILDFIIAKDFIPARMKLHTEAAPVNPQLFTLGDVVPPAWGGYADITPTWTDADIDVDGNAFVTAPVITFIRAGAGIAENVHGWSIIAKNQDGNDYLIAVYWFAAPVAVTGPDTPLKIIPKLYDVSPVV